MKKKTVGIIVKNDYDDILYYEKNFFIKIDICKKDEIRFVLKDKLREMLDNKALRIDKISKKIPKLNLSDGVKNDESMVMYIVKVYMYSDNSDFLPEKDILDRINTSLYKEYYVKYIMRYEKYSLLVSRYIGVFMYLLGTMIMLDFPFEINLTISLFEEFWIFMIVCMVLSAVILEKIIEFAILNYLINKDLSEKSFKVVKWLYWIAYIIFLCAMLNNIGR